MITLAWVKLAQLRLPEGPFGRCDHIWGFQQPAHVDLLRFSGIKIELACHQPGTSTRGSSPIANPSSSSPTVIAGFSDNRLATGSPPAPLPGRSCLLKQHADTRTVVHTNYDVIKIYVCESHGGQSSVEKSPVVVL